MRIKDLERKWEKTSQYSGGFLLVSGNHPKSFHVGYYGEQMCFMVLDVEKTDKINSSKAISASFIETAENKYALQFILNYTPLSELFVKLCWDLIECSRESEDPVGQILKRFNSWISLLQKKGEDILSLSAQKGLIGELMFLKEAIKTYGNDKALDAWVGPEGSDQDYIFNDCWAEIKATTISSTTISISSLQQLDRRDYGELHVYFMDKTSSQGLSTVSLPQVIEVVEQELKDAKLIDIFGCKLAMCGYYSKDSDSYYESRFRFTEKRVYGVVSDFPRLIREDISVAIHSAQYELEISSIEKYRK